MRTADQVMEMADLMSNDEIQETVIAMIDKLAERVSESTPSMRIITDAKLTATTQRSRSSSFTQDGELQSLSSCGNHDESNLFRSR